ncbi:MAG: sigma-70 family RNA polymerase sigma factor [Woeseiaceae bacterium]
MISELAQIEAAKKGSVEAFTSLVNGFRPGLLRFLVTRTSTYADAEDALQDTLINAYRYLHSYDSRWRFRTWLYRIAVNTAAKIRRADTVELGELSSEESGPLEQCVAAADRENLWLSARNLLSDEAYAAMWLRYVEDMSVKDISAVLERSVSWTKVNLLRARRLLEAKLSNETGGSPMQSENSEAHG